MIDSYQYNDHSHIGGILDALESSLRHARLVGGAPAGSIGERKPPTKPLVWTTKAQQDRAMELARTGQYTCTMIERETGVRQGSVRKMAIRLGINVPKGRRQKKATA
jgi:hypothetical protein